MSDYATTSDLLTRLGTTTYNQVTDRSGGVTPSTPVAQEALDAAEGRINATLASRYETPVSTTSLSASSTLAAHLKDMALSLATAHLFRTHPSRNKMPDRLRELYDEAMELLDKISEGKAELPGASTLPDSVVLGTSASAGGDARVFTEAVRLGL